MKIWLCGITQNEKQNIDDMTKDIYQYFDGLIFVDGGSTDGTLEILNARKGQGKIVNREWSNDHDLQMNGFLRANVMENGDWFIIRDSCERLDLDWVKNLRNFIENFLEKNKINTCVDRQKAFLVKYFDDMVFQGSPHWGLQGMRGGYIDLYEHYAKNQKMFGWEERPAQRKHYIDSDMKYYFVYGRSNHCVLHYYDNGKTPERYQQQEEIRQTFRRHCETLGIKFNLDSLKEYFKNNTTDEKMKFFINNERLIRRFYRLNILNQSLESIDKNEEWRLNSMNHFYENIHGWFDYPALYKHYISNAQDNYKSIEIGVYKGKSTAFMGVEIINSNKKLTHYALDHFYGNNEHREEGNSAFTPEAVDGTLYDLFLKNIEPVKNVIVPINKDSREAYKDFEDDFFDLIFIDGHHGYEECLTDMKLWYPKLKKNGIFAGHDLWCESVSRAVNEFLHGDSTVLSGCWFHIKK